MQKNSIHINPKELSEALQTLTDMDKALSDKFVNKTLRKNSKPMLEDMKQNAPTADNDNIVRNLKITTAKKKVRGSVGVRVGVLGNDTVNLKRFSAPALAGTLEYGTEERFRNLKSLGIVTGRSSTGRITDRRRFLRPAYDRNEEGLMNNTESDIDSQIKAKIG